MERVNLHATTVVLDGYGVLIFGQSGSGKTALAMTLIERFQAAGNFASLVADDRIWLTSVNGRLIATAPDTIAGLSEMRGFGPAYMRHEPQAVIDLVVALDDASVAPRHRGDESETILGTILPKLVLASRDAAASARAVQAWIRKSCIDKRNRDLRTATPLLV